MTATRTDVVNLLTTVKPWLRNGLPASSLRPSYLGSSVDALSWTRPVLTYAYVATDFAVGGAVAPCADNAYDAFVAGDRSVVLVDYGFSWSTLVAKALCYDLSFPRVTARLWAQNALRPLWNWQEETVDSPAELAFDTHSVLLTFTCLKGAEYELELHIRQCLSVWTDRTIQQHKIYIYPISSTMTRSISVSGCFDNLRSNSTPLVGWAPLSAYGLDALPDYLAHLAQSPFTKGTSHWWTAAGFFDEAIRHSHEAQAYQTLVSFVTVLESLMGSKTNAANKLAERVAGVCGDAIPPSAIPGLTLADYVKQVWNVRSDIVHGNAAGYEVLSEWATQVGDAANSLTDIVRQSLVRYTLLAAPRRLTKDRGTMNDQFGRWIQNGQTHFPVVVS